MKKLMFIGMAVTAMALFVPEKSQAGCHCFSFGIFVGPPVYYGGYDYWRPGCYYGDALAYSYYGPSYYVPRVRPSLPHRFYHPGRVVYVPRYWY